MWAARAILMLTKERFAAGTRVPGFSSPAVHSAILNQKDGAYHTVRHLDPLEWVIETHCMSIVRNATR